MEVHDNTLHFCYTHLRTETYSIDRAKGTISIKRQVAGSQMSLPVSLVVIIFFSLVIMFNLTKTQMEKYFLQVLKSLWEHVGSITYATDPLGAQN